MTIETFANGSSLLHRLDPRVKIAAAFPCAFLVALAPGFRAPLLGLAGALILVVAGRLRPGKVAGSLKPLVLFLFMMGVLLPFSVPGSAVVSLGPVSASREGAVQALSIGVKSLAVVLMTFALLGTSTTFDLMHAMSHFRVPPKLLFLAFLSFRYLFVLQVEFNRLRTAMKARGFRPGTNLHTYRSYGYLLGMLLIRSYERSERVYDAMLCRGFQGRFFLLDHFALEKRDIAFIFAMALFMALTGWVAWSPAAGSLI